MSYNIITNRERNPPPIKANVLPRQHEGVAEGWREIVPFVAPEGMVAKVGTRQIVVTDDVPQEVYEVWTVAEHEAAQRQARKDFINEAMADPVTSVLVRAIKFLAGKHELTEQQVNAKLAEWVDEEVNQ
jgi:hypothetical protein